jgi:hypothetical protein
MQSAKFTLNKNDAQRIFIHLVWYSLGYGIIAAVREIAKIDLGDWNSVVGLAAGAICDAISRFLAGK